MTATRNRKTTPAKPTGKNIVLAALQASMNTAANEIDVHTANANEADEAERRKCLKLIIKESEELAVLAAAALCCLDEMTDE